MKVVLVHTPVVEKPPYDFRYNEYLLMPLGILSIATTLKKNGHEVKIIDAYVERLSVNAMIKRIFVMIYDSVFPSNRKKGFDFLRMMVESGLNRSVNWFFQTRVELLDEELVVCAQKAGCSRISLGIESGDSDILRSINKTFSPDDAISVSKIIRKYDICVSANFMFGHIGDTSETMKRTSRLSRAMDIDEATFYLLTPYPGTKTFELAKENHEVLSRDWDDYLKSGKFSDQKVAFVPKGLSAKQLLNMRRSAFLRFYLRPNIIWRDFVRMGPYYHSLKYLLKVSSFFYDILLHLFDKGSTAHEGGVG